MVKQVLARRSKPERRQDRASVGPIRDKLVLPKTLDRYKHSFDTFRDFLWHQVVVHRGTALELVDFRLVEYIEHLWQEGEGKTVAEYTYASLHISSLLSKLVFIVLSGSSIAGASSSYPLVRLR